MPEISILVDNYSGHNKNNVTTRFLKIINALQLFGTGNLHFYIKGHTNNDFDHALTALMCCTGRKTSLILRSDVKF